MACSDCKKRETCTEICLELEENLEQYKEKYREVSYDPQIMDKKYPQESKDFWNYGVEEKDIDLGRLTQRQRECYVMRYQEGLTQGEIAERLGINQPNVCIYLQNAREKLKR